MKIKFLIGEIAELYEISKQTLIYYDKIGLLTPIENKSNGYRYYSYEHIDRLDLILNLKETGMGLKEIKKYLDNRNIDNCVNILKKQRKSIDSKIEHLNITKSKLDKKIEIMNNYKTLETNSKCFIKDLNKRYFIVIKVDRKSGDLDTDIAIKKLMTYVRQTEKLRMYSYNIVGVSVSKDNIVDGNYLEINKVFIIIDKKEVSEHLNIIPKGKYAIIYHRGKYSDTSRSYNKLMEFIKSNDYEIVGDSIEIPLMDYWICEDENNFLTEIQIPVQLKKD